MTRIPGAKSEGMVGGTVWRKVRPGGKCMRTCLRNKPRVVKYDRDAKKAITGATSQIAALGVENASMVR